MNCIIFISAACTIALHLYLRNLQTEFAIGKLVVIVCFFVLVLYVATFIHNRYQFTHKVNNSGSICAVFVYVRGTLVFFYHSTVITIFFHFTYLMYSTLKLRSKKSNFDIHLTCKYITVIISLTTVCALIIMSYDIAVSRNAFATKNGYCAFEDNSKGLLFILVILLSLAIAVQLVLFAFGMILYLLVTRNSCEFKTIDFKVCLALISTSGLNTVLFLTSYFLVQSTGIPFLLSSVGTLVEQLVLLIISSVKVTRAVTSNSTEQQLKLQAHTCKHYCVLYCV